MKIRWRKISSAEYEARTARNVPCFLGCVRRTDPVKLHGYIG